ncbi:hypothetical protein [Novosphingobium humi]|uniref:Uncharacterized protein n=1 Tax=Novosphingobium humi TaxID=2282397 RepID=A0ABY7U6V8_9SPHN|nr:hypothetical protein [Novosphingobium humi]WCT80069.1 hypothetical protein PQ457_18600 [Novosphingobium humi]
MAGHEILMELAHKGMPAPSQRNSTEAEVSGLGGFQVGADLFRQFVGERIESDNLELTNAAILEARRVGA